MKKYEMKFANLLIVEQSDGLLITQNKRTILARKWQLTDNVIAILNCSILKGFDKLTNLTITNSNLAKTQKILCAL